MGFIKRAIGFLVSPSHFRTIAVLAVLVVAVPLTVFVSQQQQNTRQRASGLNTCDPVCSSTEICKSINEGDSISYICIPNDFTLTPTPIPSPTIIAVVSSLTPMLTPTLNPNTCNPACNSGETCKSINEGDSVSYICIQNAFVLSPTPTLTPTTIPTPTPTISIPTNTPTPAIPSSAIIQNSPTPTPFPYCYLKSKGDADCDNRITTADGVNDAKTGIWQVEFVSELNGITTQKKSDFNNDGIINIVDFNIWKTNFEDPSLPH